MRTNPHPIFVVSRSPSAVDDCRRAIRDRRAVRRVDDLARELALAAADHAIVVVEHDPDGEDAPSRCRELAGFDDRARMHVLVADPRGDLAPFVAVDAGADDFVVDGLAGREFAYRLHAADAALHLVERGDGSRAPHARPAAPLAAAELSPTGDPRTVLTAAAREAARIAGGEVGFVMRFRDSVAVLDGIWGIEPTPPGATFEIIDTGCLAVVRATGRSTRVDLEPRPLGREQSQSWYIRPVYRSGLAAPLRLGTELWGALLVGSTSLQLAPPDAGPRLADFAERVAVTIGISQQRARIARLAESDLQTGLMRREVLEARFAALAGRSERPLSLALISISRLPEVRAALGPSAVHHVLAGLGERLASFARRGDVQARWSEHELVWMFEEAQEELVQRMMLDAGAMLARAEIPGLGPLGVATGWTSGAHGDCARMVGAARDAIICPLVGAGTN